MITVLLEAALDIIYHSVIITHIQVVHVKCDNT